MPLSPSTYPNPTQTQPKPHLRPTSPTPHTHPTHPPPPPPTHAKLGCRSPSTDRIASRRTLYDRTSSLKLSSGTASHASSTFTFNPSGLVGQPRARIHLTIHDHTTSIKLRSGEFGGHAGSRPSSLVCLVIWAFLSCSLR